MVTLFWVSAFIIGYVYVGYPLLLAIWAAAAGRPVRTSGSARRPPALSIIVAARNEAARLPARIANLLDIPYPGPREVIAAMTKIHQYTIMCAPTMAQVAALEALKAGEESVVEAPA